MSVFRPWVIAGVISFGILLVTALVSEYLTGVEWLDNFCFSFHLIPFGLAYAGGSGLLILAYYLGVWSLMTLVIRVFVRVKNR